MNKNLRIITGTLVGSLIYVILNWIPLLGPLSAGLAGSRIAKGRGFLVGVLSGIFGFAVLLFFVFPRWGISGNFFLMWILLFWNLIGIILAGLGGLMGYTTKRWSGFSYQFGSGGVSGRREKERRDSIDEPGTPEMLVICPACGSSNPDGSVRCNFCGGPL